MVLEPGLGSPKTDEVRLGPPSASEAPVLAVDLDGTLIKTDLLYESLWAALSAGPYQALLALLALRHGRARLKSELARRVDLRPSDLPYNDSVVSFIRAWRDEGGRCALVTASDKRFAQSIADHLGLFDEVYASDGQRNIKGQAKADLLIAKFGEGGFDYIGDSQADLPVWKCARQAITVGLSRSLKRRVEAVSQDVNHLEASTVRWQPYVRALRPHQWLKNILILLPALAAHDLSQATWSAAILAFLSFCFVASSVYIQNDLLDLGADRAHPRKRSRPFASGEVPLSHGTLMAPILLCLGVLLALVIGHHEFFAVLVGYYALTLAYSFVLKRKLVIDICALAGLYTLRILAGGAATGLPLSVWLLAFSIFLFLSLAAVKRQAELVDGVKSGRMEISGRAYAVADLPIISTMALASGYVAVLVLALYVNSDAVTVLYTNAELLWVVCPVLLYWVSRMVMIAHRGSMDDDPIVYAVRDRVSLLCGLVVVGAVVAGSIV